MRYYIADLHFGHRGLLQRMDKRGFPDVETMNQYMIHQWNSRVRRNDEVVILGDFCFGSGTAANEIAKQLNGNKYLILGNHDKFVADKAFEQSLFKWIKPYEELKDNKRKVILSHYYMPTYNGQFRRDENDNPTTWMLYGHVHNTLDQKIIDECQDIIRNSKRRARGYEELKPVPSQAINCFCMFSDYIPLTLDEWIDVEKTRKEKFPYQED